jgi:DNA-directed RNA polymerase specialized sigma24 family protein
VSTRSAALAAIRRCQEARRRGAVVELDSMLEQTAKLLEHPRLAKFRRLERQLAHLPPGERAAVIRERMGGLSKSAYYRIRALLHSDEQPSRRSRDRPPALPT